MIKELTNFTQSLDESFKNNGVWPSEGLHVFISKNENNKLFIESYKYIFGDETKKTEEINELLFYDSKGRFRKVDNKVKKFDSGQKIHSCSPFCFSFNFSLGSNKEKIDSLTKKAKNEFYHERNEEYNDKNLDHKKILNLKLKKSKIEEVEKNGPLFFINASNLCLSTPDPDIIKEIEMFKDFCCENIYEILSPIQILKAVKNKDGSDGEKTYNVLDYLSDKSYVNFYLKTIEKNIWEKAFDFYSGANLFNTNEYISKNSSGEVFGISGFLNSVDSGGNKPFLMHKTASFDITSRISTNEANLLNDFLQLISRKGKDQVLPNPFPLCVFENERERIIGLFREDSTRLGYKDIIEKIHQKYIEELGNYYLVFYSYGDIRDFDFVSKFEYDFKGVILNHFELKDKESKQTNPPIEINNVFELEKKVFKLLIKIKYTADYFVDLKDVKGYDELPNTFISLTKYRKAIYDFVYKSKKQGIDSNVFYDLTFNHIKDDLKHNRSYSIKEKLNIWFSLYEQFIQNNTNEKTMASKLKDYREFVEKITKDEVDFDTATDEQFMFVAGQVIDYLMSKSKSADTSYQLLEPYTQKSNCKELQKAIANDFARYKHATYSGNFEKAASFVLTYETKANLKSYLPELLAGVFSKNQLFPSK